MKKVEENKCEGTKLHNARFYKIAPRPIEFMAYNEILRKMAIVRSDHSIELWNVDICPCIEAVIPKAPGVSVEAVVWSGERLFSVGITGFLVEWDFKTLKVKRQLYATGNSIWCVARSPDGNHLAVGTEEGYITVYDISNDNMVYEKLLDKQAERIICIEYDRSGELLVTGSIGFIKVWNIASGKSTMKMSIGRAFRHQEATVWCLQVLSDLTIICGDSRGYISIWDGNMGAMIESQQVLKADVLTISANKAENVFLVSGVDPVIKIYSKTLIKREDSEVYRWVKCLQRRVHDHDVKSVIIVDSDIYSGSVDGFFAVSSVLRCNTTAEKYGPFLKGSCLSVAKEKGIMLVRYPTFLEVWSCGREKGYVPPKLPAGTNADNPFRLENAEPLAEEPNHQTNSEETTKENGEALLANYEDRTEVPLGFLPKKLLVLKSKNRDLIICSVIAPNAKWLCFSTLYETRLFALNTNCPAKSRGELKLIKNLPEDFKDGVSLHFSSDSKRLFMLQAQTQEVLIMNMEVQDETEAIEVIERIHLKNHLDQPAFQMVVSPCSMYIAIYNRDNRLAFWHAKNGQNYEYLLSLPRYGHVAKAITFRPNQPSVVICYSDNKLVEYDLEARCFTCVEFLDFVENSRKHCVQNVVLSEDNPNVLLLQNDSFIFALEKVPVRDNDEATTAPPRNKVTRKSLTDREAGNSSQDSNASQTKPQCYTLKCKMEKSYEHLVDIQSLNSRDVVALVVHMESFIQAMPPVLKQKKFGAS